MYVLAYPWLLILAVVPLVMRPLLAPYRQARRALRVPWFERLATLTGATPAPGAMVARASRLRLLWLWLLWCLLVVAVARPQLLEPPLHRVTPTRDLLLLVDLSGSMDARDFTNAVGEVTDRLTAVKEVLADFLTRREGDRVGLIVFGSAAFVQAPFTQDLAVCRQLLAETSVRMAGPRTAFGDAIGLGINLFERSEVSDRMMVVLTDGNDTASGVPPAEAARIAADHGIVVHVVGVGDPTATGEEALDVAALETVARVTGGRFFRAEDRDELAGIYDELDRLDTREIETVSFRPRQDLYWWPLAGFLVLSLLSGTVQLLVRGGTRGRRSHG